MAAGVCVRMRVKLSIFIKGRVTSRGDRVSRYCELSEGGGTREDRVNAFQKPAQDETLSEEFYGLCEPLGKCPQTRTSGCDSVAEAQTHSINVKCNCIAKKLGKLSLPPKLHCDYKLTKLD